MPSGNGQYGMMSALWEMGREEDSDYHQVVGDGASGQGCWPVCQVRVVESQVRGIPGMWKLLYSPWQLFPLRVEFLLKTDGKYPKDTGVNKPWQLLGIPSAITPIGQLHQSPPSPIPGVLERGPSHQSHVLEHRDTYG